MTTRNQARRRKGAVRQIKHPGWDEQRRAYHADDVAELEEMAYAEQALAARDYWKGKLGAQASFVYAIRSNGQDAVKIGHTTGEPMHRLAELQCGNPADLYIAGLILGSKKTERDLHGYWADARLRGEWFGKGCEHAILALYGVIATVQVADYEDGSDAIYVRDQTAVAVLTAASRVAA